MNKIDKGNLLVFLLVCILAIFLTLIVYNISHAWTSAAAKFLTTTRSPRQIYEDNRALQGRESAAAKHIRTYNEPVHIGISETWIRQRIVIPVEIDDINDAYFLDHPLETIEDEVESD